MKSSMTLGILLLSLVYPAFSWSATSYIRVDELDAKTQNGETLVFKGGDAYKLLQLLPQDSVYSGSRRLTVTGSDRSFTLSCLAKSKQVGDRTLKMDPSSTVCRLVVDKSFKPDQESEAPKIWSPEF